MSVCIWECAMPGWGRIRKGKECSLLCHSAHYLHPGSELNRDDSIDRMILRTICTLTRWLPKPPRDRWCLTLLRSRQPCPPRPWVTAGFRAARQTRRSRIRQPSLETTAVFGITPSPPGVSRFGPTCALSSALASVAAMAKMLFMRASKQGCRAEGC